MDSARVEDYLRILIAVSARSQIGDKKVLEIITKKGFKKGPMIYNMCDGTKSQVEISKAAKVDTGNLSRTLAGWEQKGVLFWIGPEGKRKPLGLFKISTSGDKD